MADDSSPLWQAIAACQAAHDKALTEALAPQTQAQARLLARLAAAPDQRLGELAHGLGMANGNLTVILGNLVKAGLVERVPGHDRRAARATLTPAGRLRALEVQKAMAEAEGALAAGLNADEQEIATRLLRKLNR
jgi:DNA-binding MarR family transcriptional regulator